MYLKSAELSKSWTCMNCSLQAQQGPSCVPGGQFTPQALGGRDRPMAVQNARQTAYDMRMQGNQRNQVCLHCLHHLLIWNHSKSTWVLKRTSNYSFHKNMKQHNCFSTLLINRNVSWAENLHIRMISEDHMTGVMLRIQLRITEIS